jgi:competence protein ComEC
MRVLLPGDVESVAETMLLFTDCDADVLKVPHHGSKTSSTEPFIDAVSPKFAVISTGGRYGHEAVSTQVLDRYQRRGIEIFRTDELGGIVLHIENGVPAFTGTR